jgi:hypothetical protein
MDASSLSDLWPRLNALSVAPDHEGMIEVPLHRILEYVSPRELEEYENNQFREWDKVERIAQQAEKEALERRALELANRPSVHRQAILGQPRRKLKKYWSRKKGARMTDNDYRIPNSGTPSATGPGNDPIDAEELDFIRDAEVDDFVIPSIESSVPSNRSRLVAVEIPIHSNTSRSNSQSKVQPLDSRSTASIEEEFAEANYHSLRPEKLISVQHNPNAATQLVSHPNQSRILRHIPRGTLHGKNLNNNPLQPRVHTNTANTRVRPRLTSKNFTRASPLSNGEILNNRRLNNLKTNVVDEDIVSFKNKLDSPVANGHISEVETKNSVDDIDLDAPEEQLLREMNQSEMEIVVQNQLKIRHSYASLSANNEHDITIGNNDTSNYEKDPRDYLLERNGEVEEKDAFKSEEDEIAVDRILKHRLTQYGKEFLIKQEDRPPQHAVWVDAASVEENLPDLLKRYVQEDGGNLHWK